VAISPMAEAARKSSEKPQLTSDTYRGHKVPIADLSLQMLQQMYHEAWQYRMFKDPVLREISNYINTDMSEWYLRSDPARSGRQPNTGVTLYDRTAIKSSNLCAEGIMGYAISRQDIWHRIEFDDERENDIGQAYLELAERHCYKQFGLSAFYDETQKFIRSLLDFSTAVMWRSENVREGRPSYKTLHLNRTYLTNDEWGDVDCVFRDLWMTPQNAVAEFGKNAVPQQIIDQYDLNRMSQWLFISFCFPRDKWNLDFSARKGDYIEVIVPSFAWYSPVRLDVYDTKPFYGARYSRGYDAGPWGIGSPGMLHLGDVKQLNGMVRDSRRIDQRMADPPVKATMGAKGRLNRTPGDASYLPPGADYALEKFEGDPKYLKADIQEMRQIIKDGYHEDFFLVLTNNIEKITQSTATGVQGIQGEKVALLSAFFMRLQYEFLEPAVQDMFFGEWAAGRLPDPPRGAAGRRVRVNMIGPLMQMQRQYLQVNSSMSALNQIGALVQMQLAAGQPGDILDNFDLSAFARDIAKVHNMPKDVIREMYRVELIRQGRAQAAAEQANLQQKEIESRMNLERARSVAAVANKTGTVPLPGSGAAQAAATASGGAGLANPQGAPMGAPLASAYGVGSLR
jgi:hypothetical protein